MKNAPFTVQEIERTIAWATDGSEDYTDTCDEGPVVPSDLRAAFEAMQSQYWDSVDQRDDGTIILYPADSRQDMFTGAYESTQVIIKARRPEWADRLVALYEARRERERAWFEAQLARNL